MIYSEEIHVRSYARQGRVQHRRGSECFSGDCAKQTVLIGTISKICLGAFSTKSMARCGTGIRTRACTKKSILACRWVTRANLSYAPWSRWIIFAKYSCTSSCLCQWCWAPRSLEASWPGIHQHLDLDQKYLRPPSCVAQMILQMWVVHQRKHLLELCVCKAQAQRTHSKRY